MYPFYIILYSVFFAQNFYAYKISIIEVNILCLFSLLRVIFTILQQKHTKKTKLSETSLIITTLIIELANLIFLAKKRNHVIILYHIISYIWKNLLHKIQTTSLSISLYVVVAAVYYIKKTHLHSLSDDIIYKKSSSY